MYWSWRAWPTLDFVATCSDRDSFMLTLMPVGTTSVVRPLSWGHTSSEVAKWILKAFNNIESDGLTQVKDRYYSEDVAMAAQSPTMRVGCRSRFPHAPHNRHTRMFCSSPIALISWLEKPATV